ncbi:MAG: flippase-like domain-containing protein [Bacteroidia bacterium]|nr:flippase-like domain-containing protein [Bacteroidia bacterium]
MAKSIKRSDILKEFRLQNIIWPILIGLAILGYTIYQVIEETQRTGQNPLHVIELTTGLFLMLGLALLFMGLRDIGYIWRMRLLTDNKLSWRSSAEIILLWEFGSALTPSVVGGSALAIFMLMKEKLTAGKSTALVFITIFLDECFYIIIFPLVLLLVDYQTVFGAASTPEVFGYRVPLEGFFWTAYLALLAYTLFLAFALFVHPRGTNYAIKKIFRWKRLRRWSEGANKLADDMMSASKEFQSKPVMFWVKSSFATFLAWMGRYLALNSVLAAFYILNINEHLTIFARQVILFQVMIVAPSPGASGFAEGTFYPLFDEFIIGGSSIVNIIALLWRFATYYPYLLIGVVLLPIWLRRVYGRRSRKQEDQELSESQAD